MFHFLHIEMEFFYHKFSSLGGITLSSSIKKTAIYHTYIWQKGRYSRRVDLVKISTLYVFFSALILLFLGSMKAEFISVSGCKVWQCFFLDIRYCKVLIFLSLSVLYWQGLKSSQFNKLFKFCDDQCYQVVT